MIICVSPFCPLEHKVENASKTTSFCAEWTHSVALQDAIISYLHEAVQQLIKRRKKKKRQPELNESQAAAHFI